MLEILCQLRLLMASGVILLRVNLPIFNGQGCDLSRPKSESEACEADVIRNRQGQYGKSLAAGLAFGKVAERFHIGQKNRNQSNWGLHELRVLRPTYPGKE